MTTPAFSLEQRIQIAVQDLEGRTLRHIDGALAKLVYLASTRDYNTGSYHHEGFFARYGPEAGGAALEACHRRAFEEVLLLPLEQLTTELEAYLAQSADAVKTTDAWRRLKAYQLLTPAPCDAVSASLFSTNIQLALCVRVSSSTTATASSSSQGAGED